MRVSAFNVVKRTRPSNRDFSEGRIEARSDGWYYVQGRDTEKVAEVPHLLKILFAANIAACGTTPIDSNKPMVDLVMIDPAGEDHDSTISEELQETPEGNGTGESTDGEETGPEEPTDGEGSDADSAGDLDTFTVTDGDDSSVETNDSSSDDDVIFESDEQSGSTDSATIDVSPDPVELEPESLPEVKSIAITDIVCRRAITPDDFKNIETKVLVDLCKQMGIGTNGTKKVLAARINKARGIQA